MKSNSPMNREQKLMFFVLAVLVMSCFTFGSILLGQKHYGWSAAIFVYTIFMVGIGFMARKRIIRKKEQSQK